jgi:hypothetical protein
VAGVTTTTITPAAGNLYDIIIQYRQNTNTASINFYWYVGHGVGVLLEVKGQMCVACCFLGFGVFLVFVCG